MGIVWLSRNRHTFQLMICSGVAPSLAICLPDLITKEGLAEGARGGFSYGAQPNSQPTLVPTVASLPAIVPAPVVPLVPFSVPLAAVLLDGGDGDGSNGSGLGGAGSPQCKACDQACANLCAPGADVPTSPFCLQCYLNSTGRCNC